MKIKAFVCYFLLLGFIVRSGLRRRRRRGAGPSASGASRGCGVGEHACQDTRREPLYRRQDGRRARHRVLVQALHVQRTVYFLPRGDRPQYGVRADPGPFARTWLSATISARSPFRGTVGAGRTTATRRGRRSARPTTNGSRSGRTTGPLRATSPCWPIP